MAAMVVRDLRGRTVRHLFPGSPACSVMQGAIRLEVTLAEATPVFDAPRVNPDDVPSKGAKGDRIDVNIEDLEAAHRNQSAWSGPAQRKNRVRGNFIYGHERDNPKRAPGYRGHMHADFAEFWIVLRGKLRWIMEGIERPLFRSSSATDPHAVSRPAPTRPPTTFSTPLGGDMCSGLRVGNDGLRAGVSALPGSKTYGGHCWVLVPSVFQAGFRRRRRRISQPPRNINRLLVPEFA
jgi:hypothetical protein